MLRSYLLLTAAVASGLAAAPVSANKKIGPPPGNFPGGSYRATCSNIHFVTGSPFMLAANCRPKASDTAAAESRLDIRGCPTNSIYNNDGRLACPYDPVLRESADAARNFDAIRSAAVIVLGRDPDVNVARPWVRFGATRPEFRKLIDSGEMQFSDAAEMLKAYLREKATDGERRDVFGRAYKEVYGTYPGAIVIGPTYDAEMKAGKAWYATIVLAERKRKNAPPAPAPTGPTTPPPPIH